MLSDCLPWPMGHGARDFRGRGGVVACRSCTVRASAATPTRVVGETEMAGGSARSLKNPSQGTRWILYSGHWSVGNLGLLGFVHAASNVHGKHFGFSG